MSTGIVHCQNMEKHQHQQIDKNMRGCMSGFFNIFDRNHILSGKRLYPKRLPPSLVAESPSGSASSVGSQALSQEFEKPKPQQTLPAPATPPTATVSPWKFSREAPRLSLDSRLHPRGIKTAAATPRRDDGSESESERQRRSPSVVARLMGLELLPPSPISSDSEKKAELRRSASESRSRDLQSTFTDLNTFPYQYTFAAPNDYIKGAAAGHTDSTKFNSDAAVLKPRMRRGVYGFGDFFPEPKPAIYEPSKDVEALKQILEAMHLKGLLRHAEPPTAPKVGRRNFVYEHEHQKQRYPYEESPIVVMKPTRNRNVSVSSPISRNARSPVRSPARSPSPGRGENRRKVKEAATVEVRRVNSPVRSPRIGNRRTEQAAAGQSPRRRRSSAAAEIRRGEDESSTVSDSSFSTDTERSNKDGKSLLERCDKLLHSIAEMTSEASNGCTELQPSPVSVLDSSFYKEDESSPSPVMKRTIDFKDMEDEIWSPSSSAEAFMLKSSDTEDNSDDHQDPDFAYVSEIIRASNYLPDDSDIFLLLEKQRPIKGRLERRLIFDTIIEILDRNRQLPPWKSASCGPSSREVWAELQRIRKKGDESEDMFEVICGVMKKDLTRDSINGWGECQLEISEAVLDIERLIFKDLIGETIRDHAMASAPRRKLVF